MSGRGGSALYTPEILALAVSLAKYPASATADFSGGARSQTCGSVVTFTCDLDADGRIAAPGVRATACAIGQAAAALFIAGAKGRDRAAIENARAAIARWLADDGAVPDWPGMEALAPARDYPGRHGAIPLAWDAALAALPKETPGS